jgi:hypothetical protein
MHWDIDMSTSVSLLYNSRLDGRIAYNINSEVLTGAVLFCFCFARRSWFLDFMALPLTFDADNTPLRTVFDLTSAAMGA